jgi:hypothetical protein
MKELQKLYDEISELTDEDLVNDYKDKLTTINDTFNDNTSDEEFHLMNQAEDMLLIAEQHFNSIALQEQFDRERDERRYEGARHLS